MLWLSTPWDHLSSVFLRGVAVWMVSCCWSAVQYLGVILYQDQFAAELKSVLVINSKLGVKERCN